MSTVQSLVPGDTPDERVFLRAADTAIPTDTPTVIDCGRAFQGGDWLHVYADLGGLTTADVRPWFYSTIVEKWYRGNVINFEAGCEWAIVEIRGEERIFFQVEASTGGPGTLRLWAGYSFSEPGRDG